MKGKLILAAAVAAALTVPASAADKVKIGFVATFSGGAAVLGKHMRDGFDLALDHCVALGGEVCHGLGHGYHLAWVNSQRKEAVPMQPVFIRFSG